MKFNLAVTAVIIILFGLTVYLGIVIGQMQRLNDDSQQYIDYWRHKTDSLADENFKLHMKVYDLKDSIITLKYGDN